MQKIASEAIVAGMILARDITSTTGNILIGHGTALTPSMGRRLKNWSIDFVFIEGEEESQFPEPASEVSPEDIKAALKEKFAGHLDDPSMLKIFNAVLDFRLNRKRNFA